MVYVLGGRRAHSSVTMAYQMFIYTESVSNFTHAIQTPHEMHLRSPSAPMCGALLVNLLNTACNTVHTHAQAQTEHVHHHTANNWLGQDLGIKVGTGFKHNESESYWAQGSRPPAPVKGIS